MARTEIDVVLATVMANRLEAITREMGAAMLRSAMLPTGRADLKKRQEAIDYLRVVAAMPLFEGLSVTTSVRAGQAPDQIIDAARESEADLIAMTTHGRTGLRRLLFGSVAEAVLRTSHVPVFVVRAAPVEAVTRVA